MKQDKQDIYVLLATHIPPLGGYHVSSGGSRGPETRSASRILFLHLFRPPSYLSSSHSLLSSLLFIPILVYCLPSPSFSSVFSVSAYPLLSFLSSLILVHRLLFPLYLLSSSSPSSTTSTTSSTQLLSFSSYPPTKGGVRARFKKEEEKKKRKSARYFLARRFWERRGHSRPPDTAPAGSRPPASMCNLLALHSNPLSSSRYCTCC